MKLFLFIFVCFLFNNAHGEEMNKYQTFWSWFTLNQDKFYSFVDVNPEAEDNFNLLTEALSKVNSDLTFEFGPKGTVREFVISASGIKKSFPDVIELVKNSPKLDKWKIIKFRPRRTSLSTVKFKDAELSPRETYYVIIKDGTKLGVILFSKKYVKSESKEWENAFYLMLDESLGEYDVESKVGFIEFATPEDPKLGKYYDQNNTIDKMATHFDEAWSRLTSHYTGECHE